MHFQEEMEGGGGPVQGTEWRKEEGSGATRLSEGRGPAPTAVGHDGGECQSVRQGRAVEGGIGGAWPLWAGPKAQCSFLFIQMSLNRFG
jgi:hypothetical protein